MITPSLPPRVYSPAELSGTALGTRFYHLAFGECTIIPCEDSQTSYRMMSFKNGPYGTLSFRCGLQVWHTPMIKFHDD